jgi:hypothetical protein
MMMNAIRQCPSLLTRTASRSAAKVATRNLPLAQISLRRPVTVASLSISRGFYAVPAWREARQHAVQEDVLEGEEEALEESTLPSEDAGASAESFQSLADKGLVNQHVIKNITDRGYANMTPVQSMTIEESLRGDDM